MSRMARKNAATYLLVEEMVNESTVTLVLIMCLLDKYRRRVCRRVGVAARYTMIERFPDQATHMNRLVGVSDIACIEQLRMDRNAFARLCFLLRNLAGLSDNKYVSVEEQVALFLSVISHHKKNSCVKFDFWRSGQTVSRYVHLVLKAILKLHALLLVRPDPVGEDNMNPRWKWFKGCVGALDGTYVDVIVRGVDKGRYRTRKGNISTNVLGACDRNMRFIYVLTGWEGSAADARVLRDVVNRPNGLRVTKGTYYLCDNGYANSEGFLTPFKGVRYHIDEWGEASARPRNFQEHYNMRHTRARNVIERAFGLIKMRWGILRSATYYPIKTQNRLVMACFLLHNFIRNEMPVDPLEHLLQNNPANNEDHEDIDDVVESIESSPQWNSWREELAQQQYSEWRHNI